MIIPVEFNINQGTLHIGDMVLPFASADSLHAGAVRMGNTGASSVLRPLSFGERYEISMRAYTANDPHEALCRWIYDASNLTPDETGGIDRSVLETIAMILSGGNEETPCYSDALFMLGAQAGWSIEHIEKSSCVLIDRLILEMTSSQEDGWTRVVFGENEPAAEISISAARRKLADNLLHRMEPGRVAPNDATQTNSVGPAQAGSLHNKAPKRNLCTQDPELDSPSFSSTHQPNPRPVHQAASDRDDLVDDNDSKESASTSGKNPSHAEQASKTDGHSSNQSRQTGFSAVSEAHNPVPAWHDSSAGRAPLSRGTDASNRPNQRGLPESLGQGPFVPSDFGFAGDGQEHNTHAYALANDAVRSPLQAHEHSNHPIEKATIEHVFSSTFFGKLNDPAQPDHETWPAAIKTPGHVSPPGDSFDIAHQLARLLDQEADLRGIDR